MEADFLRDYGIRLAEQIDSMTWRCFLALLSNLSPGGAVAARVRALREADQDGEAAAERFFARATGGGKG